MDDHFEVIYIMLSLSFILLSAVFLLERCVSQNSHCFANATNFTLKSWISCLNIARAGLYWATLSISFIFFNKWFLTKFENGSGFSFPFFITTIHMSGKFVFTQYLFNCTSYSSKRPKITSSNYYLFAVPIGICTSSDIALSIYAFTKLSISAYTVIKSCTVLFVFILSIILGLEKLNFEKFMSVLGIACGLVTAVWAFQNEDYIALVACIFATIISAIRWPLTQYIVDKMNIRDTLGILYLISPSGFYSILPIFFLIELPALSRFINSSSSEDIYNLTLILMGGGILSIALVLSEIKVIETSSSLTFTVLGSVKELFQIILAVMITGDIITIPKVLGIALCSVSIVWYSFIKAKESKDDMQTDGLKYRKLAIDDIDEAFNDEEGYEMNFLNDD